MRFFFYGTLLDPDVRRLVIGSGAEALPIEPATLEDYCCFGIHRRHYPAVAPRPGESVAGCLMRGLDPAMAERIFAFEGEEYDPRPCAVATAGGQDVPAWVFVANRRAALSPAPWDIASWQRRHKTWFLRRLRRGLV